MTVRLRAADLEPLVAVVRERAIELARPPTRRLRARSMWSCTSSAKVT
jgi:hypothetical protein